jgi:hypothetical protein
MAFQSLFQWKHCFFSSIIHAGYFLPLPQDLHPIPNVSRNVEQRATLHVIRFSAPSREKG